MGENSFLEDFMCLKTSMEIEKASEKLYNTLEKMKEKGKSKRLSLTQLESILSMVKQMDMLFNDILGEMDENESVYTDD